MHSSRASRSSADLSQELDAFGLALADFSSAEVVDLIASRLPCDHAAMLRRAFAKRGALIVDPAPVEPDDKVQIGPLDV